MKRKKQVGQWMGLGKGSAQVELLEERRLLNHPDAGYPNLILEPWGDPAGYSNQVLSVDAEWDGLAPHETVTARLDMANAPAGSHYSASPELFGEDLSTWLSFSSPRAGTFSGILTVTQSAPGFASETQSIPVTFPVQPTPVHVAGRTLTSNSTAASEQQIAFISANGPTDPANYSTQIDWGDGTTTTGGVVDDGSGWPNSATYFAVTGSHTYASAGEYNVGTTVTYTPTDGTPPIVTSAASHLWAIDGKLNIENQSDNSNVVDGFQHTFVFSYVLPSGQTSAPRFLLKWGDGNCVTNDTRDSGVTFTTRGDRVYITAAHAFEFSNSYRAELYVVESWGGGSWKSTIAVANAPVIAVPSPTLVADEGNELDNIVLAHFRDTNPEADPSVSPFTAMVNWGDGSGQAEADIEPDPSGNGYDVVSHDPQWYSQAGTYTVQVTIIYPWGRTLLASVSLNADIKRVPPSVTVTGPNFTDTATPTLFTIDITEDPGKTVSAFKVDFGDGTPPLITTDIHGTPATDYKGDSTTDFTATVSHIFATSGSHVVRASVMDQDGIWPFENGDATQIVVTPALGPAAQYEGTIGDEAGASLRVIRPSDPTQFNVQTIAAGQLAIPATTPPAPPASRTPFASVGAPEPQLPDIISALMQAIPRFSTAFVQMLKGEPVPPAPAELHAGDGPVVKDVEQPVVDAPKEVAPPAPNPFARSILQTTAGPDVLVVKLDAKTAPLRRHRQLLTLFAVTGGISLAATQLARRQRRRGKAVI